MLKTFLVIFQLFFFELGLYASIIAFAFLFSIEAAELHPTYTAFIFLAVWVVYGFDRLLLSETADNINHAHSSSKLNHLTHENKSAFVIFFLSLATITLTLFFFIETYYYNSIFMVTLCGFFYFLNHHSFDISLKLQSFLKPHLLSITWVMSTYIIPVNNDLIYDYPTYLINLYIIFYLNAIATDYTDIAGDIFTKKPNFWVLFSNKKNTFLLLTIGMIGNIAYSFYTRQLFEMYVPHIIQAIIITLLYADFKFSINISFKKNILYDLPLLLIALNHPKIT